MSPDYYALYLFYPANLLTPTFVGNMELDGCLPLHGVLKAASVTQQPLILQLTRSSIEYMGLHTAVNLGRTGLKEFGVEGWIHLDHGDSVELTQRCLDVGFDSVMIDGSELPFEENIAITKEVVKRAKTYNAHVEAELGYVAKLKQSHAKKVFTQPKDICFVSYANLPMNNYTAFPPLASVEQFPYQQGQKATETLIELIQQTANDDTDTANTTYYKIILESQLVVHNVK